LRQIRYAARFDLDNFWNLQERPRAVGQWYQKVEDGFVCHHAVMGVWYFVQAARSHSGKMIAGRVSFCELKSDERVSIETRAASTVLKASGHEYEIRDFVPCGLT
jgi:hypothetical protein